MWATSATQAPGTTRWMAPELVEGAEAKVSVPGDIYAYAMTAYEVTTGVVPFHNLRRDPQVVLAIVRGDRPPRPTDPPISQDMWALLEDCWIQDLFLRPRMPIVVDRLSR